MVLLWWWVILGLARPPWSLQMVVWEGRAACGSQCRDGVALGTGASECSFHPGPWEAASRGDPQQRAQCPHPCRPHRSYFILCNEGPGQVSTGKAFQVCGELSHLSSPEVVTNSWQKREQSCV